MLDSWRVSASSENDVVVFYISVSLCKCTRTSTIDVERHFHVFNQTVEVRYWLPRRGRDEIAFERNPLEIERLQTFGSERWFRQVSDDGGAFWKLRHSLQLQTDATNPIVYTLGTSDVWVFRKESERDESWLSQRNMQLYEEHLIVFRKKLANRVVTRLKQTCGPEIEKPSPIRVSGKWNGWLYLRVKPTQLCVVLSRNFGCSPLSPVNRCVSLEGYSLKTGMGAGVTLTSVFQRFSSPILGS